MGAVSLKPSGEKLRDSTGFWHVLMQKLKEMMMEERKKLREETGDK